MELFTFSRSIPRVGDGYGDGYGNGFNLSQPETHVRNFHPPTQFSWAEGRHSEFRIPNSEFRILFLITTASSPFW